METALYLAGWLVTVGFLVRLNSWLKPAKRARF